MFYETLKEQGFSDFYFSGHYIDHKGEPHIHSHMELVFVLRGELGLYVDKREYSISSGNLAILLPYQVHSYRSISSSECFILACPAEYIPEYRQILRSHGFSSPVVPYGEDTGALLPEMIRACAGGAVIEQGQQSSFKKKALLYCTLADLLEGTTLIEHAALEPDIYRSAILYISRHYTEKLELSAVARELGVSPSHLSRVLSNKSGAGFTEILNSLRGYEARRLLLQTELSVSQIALEAGFGSIRNFNRVFQKQFQCMPKDFRKGILA